MKNLTTYLEQFVREDRKALLKRVLDNRTKHFTLAVEDIYQSHNANAIVRSAECFGVQEVHVVEDRNDFGIRRGISRGAIKWVDIHNYNSSTNCMQKLREKGYQIIATTPHTNDVLLDDFDISKPSAFFLGTELRGLSKTVIENADVCLRIPIYGFTESYNVSVCASIIMHHLIHKLRQREDVEWQLSEKDKEALYLKWIKSSVKNVDLHLKNFEKIKNS